MREREYLYAKNVAKLQIARAIIKRLFCVLEREEREQQAALRAIDKLMKMFESRCYREGPER
ncbi:MAG TPA: hypothetical protein VFK84_02445 [Burkholderiales bacterium]|nr:hypothetical protein [Burkholderiales bacterium]